MIRFQIFKIVDDDYYGIHCCLSIDFDQRLLWHSVSFIHWLQSSMSSIVNVDRYGSTMITVGVFQCHRWSIVSDRRRSSMSSMILLSFHSVVCSCTQQGQGDFLDVWIRKWCRTKLQIFSFMECYFWFIFRYEQRVPANLTPDVCFPK